jgi:choline dehydrogenase-like flavoprotein
MPDRMRRRDWLRRVWVPVAAGALACGRRPAEEPAADFDVCVIGSGFAGTFLGLRLVERGIRTVMLEAGPWLPSDADPDGDTSLFPSRSTGDYAFPIDANRTIAVGGTSRKWNGVVTRLLPQDFRARSASSVFADWPIGYDELSAYYCEAEQALHASGGPFQRGAEPARACAYPAQATSYTSPAPLFRTPMPFFPLPFGVRNGSPLRLDQGEIQRFTAASSATLLAEHPVAALVMGQSGGLEAAEVRRGRDEITRIRARYFVVAAGVVETARLLLASRSREFPNGIGNATDLVGRGFNAHPRFRIVTPAAPGRTYAKYAGIHRTYARHDAGRRAGGNGVLADVHLGGSETTVDVMLELEAAAGNRIALAVDDERDRWGRPLAVLDANWTARDRLTREQALAFQRELTLALAPNAAPSPPALRWFHPAGTCPMAHRPEEGVVNADCRVFGVDNLYLAGASVFRVAGSGNPTLTIVALSLRLGDHLLQRLGR